MTSLFFLAARDNDGENNDLFVRTSSATAAIAA